MRSDEILFADDDPAFLDLGTTLLRRANYEVAAAANGDIALHLLEEKASFWLLIADVVLPGSVDGFGLARRAKELRPTIQIIYVTGFPVVANIRSRGAPWGKTLFKPFERDELVKTVESIFPPYGGSTTLPPSRET
jgi:DNA-binding NtrC family response regulator